MLVQTFKAQLLGSKADQGVLDNHVLNACFTQFAAELGIILYVDALVIDQHTGRRILDLLYQRSDKSLLFFQNLCIRHLFHLLKNKSTLPVQRHREGTQKTLSAIGSDRYSRFVLTSAGGGNAFQAMRLPAVFDQALILYALHPVLSSFILHNLFFRNV